MKVSMTDADDNTMAALAFDLLKEIRPKLAGHGPWVQGAVLADLTATWLAGHQPAEMRETILAAWLSTMRNLVPLNEATIEEQTAKPNRKDLQ